MAKKGFFKQQYLLFPFINNMLLYIYFGISAKCITFSPLKTSVSLILSLGVRSPITTFIFCELHLYPTLATGG